MLSGATVCDICAGSLTGMAWCAWLRGGLLLSYCAYAEADFPGGTGLFEMISSVSGDDILEREVCSGVR